MLDLIHDVVDIRVFAAYVLSIMTITHVTKSLQSVQPWQMHLAALKSEETRITHPWRTLTTYAELKTAESHVLHILCCPMWLAVYTHTRAHKVDVVRKNKPYSMWVVF